MLTQICAYLKNYFLVDYLNPDERIHYGTFTISNGQIEDLPFLDQNQYFRVVGSVFNDGVHKYGADALVDETFTGAIWAISVPPDVIALSSEIESWIENNASAVAGPYQSESFGGYSYSLKGGSSTSGPGADVFGWQAQFAARLAPYRRLSVL